MSLYPRRHESRGVNRKTFDILVLVVAALVVTCGILIVIMSTSSTSDDKLHETLVEIARREEESARTVAAQIPRLASTETVYLLSRMQQHLYAMQQLNELHVMVNESTALIPQQAISDALSAVAGCQALWLQARAIDQPLGELRSYMAIITEAVSAL